MCDTDGYARNLSHRVVAQTPLWSSRVQATNRMFRCVGFNALSVLDMPSSTASESRRTIRCTQILKLDRAPGSYVDWHMHCITLGDANGVSSMKHHTLHSGRGPPERRGAVMLRNSFFTEIPYKEPELCTPQFQESSVGWQSLPDW